VSRRFRAPRGLASCVLRGSLRELKDRNDEELIVATLQSKTYDDVSKAERITMLSRGHMHNLKDHRSVARLESSVTVFSALS
jgi:hypothetical protein